MMAISDAEKEEVDRAEKRVEKSGLDGLTSNSTLNALSAAKAALHNPTDELVAMALFKLTLAFAHSASGAPQAAADASVKAVSDHEKNRHDKQGSVTTTTVTTPPAQKMTTIEFIDKNIKWIFYLVVVVLVLMAISQPLSEIGKASAATALQQRGKQP